MIFKKNRPIYLQIVDYLIEQILHNEWPQGARIPSVRDLGGILEVNPNTVMRAYRDLEEKDVLYNQRGIGFFVSKDAEKRIRKIRKEIFLKEELPDVYKKMALLDLSVEDVTQELVKLRKRKKK
jgi:DNA-binding transcriptional regulator YhcF (GntR family)